MLIDKENNKCKKSERKKQIAFEFKFKGNQQKIAQESHISRAHSEHSLK